LKSKIGDIAAPERVKGSFNISWEEPVSKLKDDLIKLIQTLPDDCTVDDVMYHLYVREKVQRGIAAAEAGQVVPLEEAERRMDAWLESSGPTPP
jgi:hypothetical protein